MGRPGTPMVWTSGPLFGELVVMVSALGIFAGRTFLEFDHLSAEDHTEDHASTSTPRSLSDPVFSTIGYLLFLGLCVELNLNETKKIDPGLEFEEGDERRDEPSSATNGTLEVDGGDQIQSRRRPSSREVASNRREEAKKRWRSLNAENVLRVAENRNEEEQPLRKRRGNSTSSENNANEEQGNDHKTPAEEGDLVSQVLSTIGLEKTSHPRTPRCLGEKHKDHFRLFRLERHTGGRGRDSAEEPGSSGLLICTLLLPLLFGTFPTFNRSISMQVSFLICCACGFTAMVVVFLHGLIVRSNSKTCTLDASDVSFSAVLKTLVWMSVGAALVCPMLYGLFLFVQPPLLQALELCTFGRGRKRKTI